MGEDQDSYGRNIHFELPSKNRGEGSSQIVMRELNPCRSDYFILLFANINYRSGATFFWEDIN